MKMFQRSKIQSRYKPLSLKEFEGRMEESFIPVYLTLISIIQAAALFLLCQQTYTLNHNAPTVLYILVTFIMIVGVSYEYNWFVGVHRWPQKFFDTLCPLIVGFWEILVIYNLSQPRNWWLMTAIFSLMGAVAFSNTWMNHKPELFEDRGLYIYFKSNTLKSIILALGGSALSFLFSAIYEYVKPDRTWYTVDLPMSIVYISLFAFIMRKDKKFLNKVYQILSLHESGKEKRTSSKVKSAA